MAQCVTLLLVVILVAGPAMLPVCLMPLSWKQLGQDVIGAYLRCRNEFDIEATVFDAVRAGDFSVRSPLVECFGECLVKRAGFMNDDFTFNRDTIMRFTNRFVSKESSEEVFNRCTGNVVPTVCSTAFEVYQCIYEHVNQKWNEGK
ncbi:general odorant-binding protein 56d-like [Anopheles aquasalis]|uniref:general odorant-binding protein 56d-like n=1 Tax=Anopheles aquasalis TaxID=42839 RepID=UPI00215AA827|nr:general odorant-binding protein 56d-like [Anopheles aquasalis]